MGQSRSPLGVADLERLAARGWRGDEEVPFGGWLLRAGGGFTGRANSVLVLGGPPEDLAAAVATVTG
ncbi:MAG TPA: GNAT family N-acetyltransferase, partial [Geodermatophilus sp.]|nr:GNAT family N-acetyltransferase [Geodermatophilus sp.]